MRRLVLALLLAVLVVPARAAADPAEGIVRPSDGADLPPLELGEQLFAGNCSSCHGSRGEGLPERGPSLHGAGAHAADFYLRTGYMPLRSPDAQPESGAPPFTDPEIEALVRYIASLGDGPPIPDPDPAAGSLPEGRQLFTEHCAGCHQVVAEGGVVTGARVPALQGVDPTTIAEAVREGPYVMPAFSEKAISDAELDSIVAYVRSTDPPADRGGWGIGHLGPFSEGFVTWFMAAVALVAVCVVIGRRARG